MTNSIQQHINIAVLSPETAVGRSTVAYFIAANLLKLHRDVILHDLTENEDLVLASHAESDRVFHIFDCTAETDTPADQTAIDDATYFAIPIFLTATMVDTINQVIARITASHPTVDPATIFVLPRQTQVQTDTEADEMYGLLRNNYRRDSRIVLLPSIPWTANVTADLHAITSASDVDQTTVYDQAIQAMNFNDQK